MEGFHQTLVYFSPTKTPQKVLSAVAEGTDADSTGQLDLTPPAAGGGGTKTVDSDLVIIGAPVYGGRIALEAVHRLKQLRGNGKPAVVIAVYGNREYEDALLELKDIAAEAGFLPVAAAAFIGEHSFASMEKPIALGRPDDEDLEAARSFGCLVKKKLKNLSDTITPAVPGNYPYKERKPGRGLSPETVESTCTLCGNCAEACPTAAITVSTGVTTDKTSCIICCACVKSCPTGSRVMQDPDIKKVTDWLFTNYSSRKNPETFI